MSKVYERGRSTEYAAEVYALGEGNDEDRAHPLIIAYTLHTHPPHLLKQMRRDEANHTAEGSGSSFRLRGSVGGIRPDQ